MSQKPPTRAMRENPDLDQLKRQAKELLEAYRASSPEAPAEVTAYHRTATPETFALHDAQFVLARSYGFESWPKLKAAVYTVTECEPGKSFVWEMKATGVKVRASHVVEDRGDGHARMVLGIEQTGALSGLIAMFYGKLTRQYVSMEAEGLKKAAETPEAEAQAEAQAEAEAEATDE